MPQELVLWLAARPEAPVRLLGLQQDFFLLFAVRSRTPYLRGSMWDLWRSRSKGFVCGTKVLWCKAKQHQLELTVW